MSRFPLGSRSTPWGRSVRDDAVAVLASALDGLCAAPPPALADGDTIVFLHRKLERLAAVVTRADAAFDAGRDWKADGARSAAAWVATRCREPLTTARRRVRM